MTRSGAENERQQVMRAALDNRAHLWGLCMGFTKDARKAEDLFQNTYLVICEKWRQYDPGTNFLAWARQIARFEFLASVDPGRRPFVVTEASVIEAALEAAGQEAPDAPCRHALRACLGEMDATHARKALELRYGEGLPGEAVARKLGITANALYTLLSRARKALQGCVERRLQLEGEGA
jgi:RNA polymerase sigma-70 factor (ECF subfamily)